MERLSIGPVTPRSGLDLRVAQPVDPARRDPQGNKQEAASLKLDAASIEGLDLAEQVAAIEKLRETISGLEHNRLKIDRHKESGHFIYRIFNQDTGETIRRWPPESYLDLVTFLRDEEGRLLDERA